MTHYNFYAVLLEQLEYYAKHVNRYNWPICDFCGKDERFKELKMFGKTIAKEIGTLIHTEIMGIQLHLLTPTQRRMVVKTAIEYCKQKLKETK